MQVARLQDWITILGVVGGFAALYISASFILLRRYLVPSPPKLGLTGFCILIATLGTFICIAYAAFIEPYNLQVTHIKIPIDGLPAGTKPIFVVQVSDTHCDANKRLEDRVAEEIEKIKPSLILFTGDAVNSLDGVDNFNKLVHRISQVAQTFAVKGDWDFAFGRTDIVRNSGLEVIGQKVLTLNGVDFSIVGENSGAPCSNSLKKAVKGLPTIVLYHNPDGDIILQEKTEGVDLYICGHTHGGQIALPFYGALITQSVQGKKYESGLHKLGNTWIYVNRGIGMEGHFPRLRFFSPPELTVFELCSAH